MYVLVHNYMYIANESSSMNIHMLRHLPHCIHITGDRFGATPSFGLTTSIVC